MIVTYEFDHLLIVAQQAVDNPSSSAAQTVLKNAINYYRGDRTRLPDEPDDIKQTTVCIGCGKREMVARPQTIENRPMSQLLCLHCCHSELEDR